MKKSFFSILFITASVAVSAQGGYDPFTDKELLQEILRSVVVFAVLWLLAAFILSMARLFLTARLKRKILETNAAENIIERLLPPAGHTEKRSAMKWFIIPAAIGIGLILVSLFPPLGIHSLIIMIFSIALGYLAYYLLIRKIKE